MRELTRSPKPRPRDWLEGRRLRALELKNQGWKQKDIAAALGVTKGAVSQWLKRAGEGGESALRSSPSTGAKSRLTADERARIPRLLESGASSFGFPDDAWNPDRIALLIKQQFGVHYHPAHVSRIMRDMGVGAERGVSLSGGSVVV